MSFISLVLFVVLQIAFIPLAIVGIVLVTYRQMVVSKSLGVSNTAIGIINGRWTMHVFGIRVDDATARLAAVLPNTSVFGLWLVLIPLWLKYKISGKLFMYPRVPQEGQEVIVDIVIARTLFFDRMIERVLGSVEQFVVMGAGYDTRAYGTFHSEGVTIFELDQESVQQHKRAALTEAGVQCDDVHFVTVDFSRESTFDKLQEVGYDRTKKSLFLWEGVTLYLSESDVRKTMQEVRSHAAPGSILLADIYADRMVNMGKGAAGKKALDYTSESFGFALPFASNYEKVLADFVASESMSVGESFFMGHGSDKGPFGVVAEIKCSGESTP
jgi:methyltransferase (TIGR00027 family)